MELNRKNLRALMLLIVFTLLLYWSFTNLELLGSLLSSLVSLLSPFLLGFCVAFVLNIILRPMESLWNRLLRKCTRPWKKRLCRPVCLTLSTAIFLGLVSTVFLVLVPQIRSTVESISSMIPQSVDKLEQWWHELSAFLSDFGAYLPELQLNSDEIIKTITDFFTAQGSAMVNKTLDITFSIFKVLFNIILALIISLYVLGQKEAHGRSCRRAIRAILKPDLPQGCEQVRGLAGHMGAGSRHPWRRSFRYSGHAPGCADLCSHIQPGQRFHPPAHKAHQERIKFFRQRETVKKL